VSEVVGDLGIRINPRSAEQIATAMLAVLRGKFQDVSHSGPAFAARFGGSSMADHFVGIYEGLREAS